MNILPGSVQWPYQRANDYLKNASYMIIILFKCLVNFIWLAADHDLFSSKKHLKLNSICISISAFHNSEEIFKSQNIIGLSKCKNFA